MNSGFFVAFEGSEGSGKSTQIRLLADRLRAAGFVVVTTREPGGTPVGERIRDILLDRSSVDLTARTEALLLSAARAQHRELVIEPALRSNAIVLTDRYADSTLAYQGGGRGLPLPQLLDLQRFTIEDVEPDLRLLLDLDVQLGLARRFSTPGSANRLDEENVLFHQRVRDTFRSLACESPRQWAVLDAGQSVAEISDEIIQVVMDRLAERGLVPA